jgi:hypothetical protein
MVKCVKYSVFFPRPLQISYVSIIGFKVKSIFEEVIKQINENNISFFNLKKMVLFFFLFEK